MWCDDQSNVNKAPKRKKINWKKKKPQSWIPKKQTMSLQFYLGQNILGQWGLNKKKSP